MSDIAYLGIGSNVGDRVAFARRTVDLLGAVVGISVIEVSSLYETAPVGGPPQRSYVNLAVTIDTELQPHDLLAAVKGVETALGREESAIRWGPRVSDVDILVYADIKLNDPELEIPHPRLTQRRFALLPLLEIAPEVTDPWGRRYADFVDEAEGEVELLEPF